MKKVLALILVCIFMVSLVACGMPETEKENDEAVEGNSQNDTIGQDEPDETFSFSITAGEPGEYGKLITYNKGTEFEETFYAYYIPAGTYTVTNKGEYMSQINIYSDETIITEEGWEEPKETIFVKLIDVEKSETITIGEGQHIEIAEPSEFLLEQK